MSGSTNVRATIKNLWHDLNARPKVRATLVANLAVNHGDAEIRAWVHRLIEQGTPDSTEKQTALAQLTPKVIIPQITIDWRGYTIRIAPELARLSIVLKVAGLFRLWGIARDISKSTDTQGNITSSGKCSRQALSAKLNTIGINYTADHYNRLLRQGEGRFWNISRTHIYTRKPSHLAKWMTEAVLQSHPDAIATNHPGTRDVYLTPVGTLAQWEATLYVGWHTYRDNPTIARDTLSMLFGRTAQTLRNWEAQQIAITPRSNYAQAILDDERLHPAFPDHTQSYINKKGETRAIWRMPNTYITTGIKQHHRMGQAFKVRQAVNQALLDSDATPFGGMQSPHGHPATSRRKPEHQTGKLYFDSARKLRGYLKTYGGVRYLWKGEKRFKYTSHGIYEASVTGWAETRLYERMRYREEHTFLAIQQLRWNKTNIETKERFHIHKDRLPPYGVGRAGEGIKNHQPIEQATLVNCNPTSASEKPISHPTYQNVGAYSRAPKNQLSKNQLEKQPITKLK